MIVRVLGLGSVLMGDDGLGPWALAWLEARWRFPDSVELLDVGTPGPEFFEHLEGADAVIVVDTVKARGGRPGELRLFGRQEILDHGVEPRLSPHDPGLGAALHTAELAGTAPTEMLFVGVVPEHVGMGTEISDTVRAALTAVEEAVVTEFRRLGVGCERRDPPAEPDAWWERRG